MKKLFLAISIILTFSTPACTSLIPALIPISTQTPIPTGTSTPKETPASTITTNPTGTSLPTITLTATGFPVYQPRPNGPQVEYFRFTNNSSETIEGTLLEADGVEHPFGSWAAGEFTDVWGPFSFGSVVLLRDPAGIILSAYILTDSPGQEVAISDAGIAASREIALTEFGFRSLWTGATVTLDFANNSSVPLDLFHMEFNGQETLLATIPPMVSGVISTYFGNAYRVRDGTGNIILDAIASEAVQQNIAISDALIEFGQTPR